MSNTDTALAAWRGARSLTELATLTADWLGGDLAAHPGWIGEPAPETAEITTELVALNRTGWLTIDSQPGYDRDAAGSMQRHAVKFILGEEQGWGLHAAAEVAGFPCSEPTGLVPDPDAAWAAQEREWAEPVMVSATANTDGAVEGSCWFGCGPDEGWDLLFGDGADDLAPELRAVLEGEATIIAVAAPDWGSDDGGLWAWLLDLAADPERLAAHRERALADALKTLLAS